MTHSHGKKTKGEAGFYLCRAFALKYLQYI